MSDQNSSQGGAVVSITNKLSVPVDIYDVFNPSSESQTLPYTYTKLGTIAAGASGTVTTIREVSMLQAMYTGKISELSDWYYYQFPVKIMSATQFSFGTPPPLSYTIDKSDWKAMIQSFLFHRFAMANPNSALTQNLNSAVKKGDVDSINTFFAGTKNFSSCTLATWNAVMSWLQMFTSGWQGPYYLYETAPSPLPDNYVPVLIATLNIVSNEKENSATLTMCSEDAKGDPVFATPPQTTKVIMAGDGTLTDADPGNDVTVSLTPVWMNVIQSTMKNEVPVSSYIAGPAVSGTVANQKVVSSQTPRQIPQSSSHSSSASTQASTSSFDAIFNKLCQVIGLIVGIAMLYEMVRQKTSKKEAEKEDAKREAKSEKEYEEKVDTIESTTSKEIAESYDKQESTISSDSKEISENYKDTAETLQKETMTETMNKEADAINQEITEQLENGVTPTENFENAVSNMESNFEEAQKSIDSGNFSEANQKLAETSENMDNVIKKQGAEMSNWESDALQKSSDAIKDASTESDALNKAQNEYEENMDNAHDDSGFDSNDTREPDTTEIPEEEMAF